MPIRILDRSDLPRDVSSHDFIGDQHGGVGACVIFFDGGPGEGPRLHRHPYVELFIVLEGVAAFTDGEARVEVVAGQIAIADANQPHGFTNSGEGRLRSIDIHLSPRFVTEWLA